MQEMVIKTRITPRRLIEKIISRERLLKILESNLSKNMILVTAPAGYGKTTLVLDFLTKLKKLFAWFYVASDVESFYGFTNYLIHSLKTLKENFGDKTLELLDSLSESGALVKDEKNSIIAITGTFVNEFVNTFEDDVYLVIDDLQNAGNASWIANTFNCLIEDFPPNLHILITTRSNPEFNVARMDAKRNLLRIDASELNFTFDETEKLLRDIYSISCNKNEISTLEDKLEGWITGLHLILQAYGNNFPSYISAKKIIDDNVFDYFANEIFNNLDEEMKDFLMATSMVDSFSDEMCSFVMPGSDNEKMIERLRKKNIFIETSVTPDNGNKTNIAHSYHNLFKQFLVKKLHELKRENEIKEIAGKIFRYYEQKGEKISAIEFSLYSEKYEKAAEMIVNEFEEVFQSGRYELLDKWIKSFPAEITNNNPFLQLYKAKLLYRFKSDVDGAYTLLEKIVKETDKNSELYVSASIEYSDIMLVKGKTKEAVKILEGLVKSKRDSISVTKVSLELAKAYYSLGSEYYDKIISLLDDTIKETEENNLREFHSEIYGRYGRVYQNRGNFSKALHYFKNVVELEKNIYKKFQTLTDIILLHAWSGEYQKAKDFLDKANDIYIQFPIPAFKREVLRITALLKFEAGDYEDSISKFLELNSFDISINIRTFIFLYNMFIAESYILLEKYGKANEFIELAEKTKHESDAFQKLLIDYHKAILQNLGNPNVNVEKILLETHKSLDEQNLIYSKVQVEFHLADYYFKTGNLKTSLKYLEDSLNTSSQKQFNSFLSQHFTNKRYLFDFASANGIQKDYIFSIHSELIERESFNWLSIECRDRLRKDSIRLYDITVNLLGGTEIYVRGKPIGEDKWIRKKSKLLLIYLLVNRELKHTKEKILELFFGELSSASADNVFHQAITNIRNVIKPEAAVSVPGEKASKKSKTADKTPKLNISDSFIVYEDKILHIAPGYLYTIDANEFNKLYSRVKSLQKEEDKKEIIAKEAIELYKGDFLPGHYDDWIEEMRMNLQNRFVEVCEELITILTKEKKYDAVITYAEKLISADKLHEEAFINLIKAYALSGNQNMAKKKFSQLLKNYEEEYGEKPSKQTLSHIEKILLDSE